jgi:RHS repeat-associated protein
MVNLTGGVLLEVTGSTETWYYPNLEGGTAAEASSTGAAVGGITLYDPFGNALRSLQADSPDGLAYGFEGKHGIVTDTDAGGVVLMGARLYNPGTGRFLQVDPVFGGSCNAYDYTCQDPVNQNDLSGRSGGQPAISGAITQCTQHGGRWNSGFGRGVYPGTRQGTDNAEAWVALGVTLGVIAAATGIGAAIEGSILLAVVSLAATAGSLYLDGKSCFHGGDNLACAGLVLDFSAGLASDGAFAAGLVGAKLLGTALGYFGVNVGLGGLSVDAVGWVFGK